MQNEYNNIKCNVYSCEYNNENEKVCNLDEIKVSCNCDPNSACKKETICDSFKEKEK